MDLQFGVDPQPNPPQGRMSAAMRRLRRDLEQCQACSQQSDCPVIQSFNARVV